MDKLKVLEYAKSAFGSSSMAQRWLKSRVPALDGKRPIDMIETEEGAKVVFSTIRKIEMGDFS